MVVVLFGVQCIYDVGFIFEWDQCDVVVDCDVQVCLDFVVGVWMYDGVWCCLFDLLLVQEIGC